MRYEYFIGLRYLRAKRRQTFVSVITGIAVAGVMVGVAALIIVLSGMAGVQDYMRDRILGFNAHLTISGRLAELEDPAKVAERIRKVPHVTGASPFLEGQVMLQGRTRSVGVLLRGIDPQTAGQVMDLDDTMVYGSLEELEPRPGDSAGGIEELPGLALGQELAAELGVFYGEEIPVIVAGGGLTPLGMRPKVRRFRIAAIFKFGFYEVDSTVVLLSLEQARDLLKNSEPVEMIEVKTDNIYTVDQTCKALEAELGQAYLCSPWFAQQRQLFAALKMEELLSQLVLSLILLVAAMNIISMLLMLVMEKYRDIAILKSMGATDGGIMRIFITQGTVIGVVGTVLGLAIGLAGCWAQVRFNILCFDPSVYQFSCVPMKIKAANLLGVGLGSILLSFLTTLYPSWQAARMKPAESLRYE